MAERSEHRAVGMGLKLVIHMEAGVGGCTAQQAVDLACTEIRIQLTILRKASNCDAKCIIYENVAVIYTNI